MLRFFFYLQQPRHLVFVCSRIFHLVSVSISWNTITFLWTLEHVCQTNTTMVFSHRSYQAPHQERHTFQGEPECLAKIAGIEHKVSHNVHRWYILWLEKHEQNYLNVFLFISPGFVKKIGIDERAVFFK